MKSIVRVAVCLVLVCCATADFHEDDLFNFPGDQMTPVDNERQPWGTGMMNAPQNNYYQQSSYPQDYAEQTTTPAPYQSSYNEPSNTALYHAYPQTAHMQTYHQYAAPSTTSARPYVQQQYGASHVPSTTASYATSYETTTTSRPYYAPQQQQPYMQAPMMQQQYAPAYAQPTTYAAPYAAYETTTTARPYAPQQQASYAQYSTTTTQRPAIVYQQPTVRPVYPGPVPAAAFRPVFMMMTPTRV